MNEKLINRHFSKKVRFIFSKAQFIILIDFFKFLINLDFYEKIIIIFI